MAPEQPVIIERICAVQISRNLQFSTNVPKFGTLFLFQSLIRQTFLVFRREWKSFYINNYWIGLAAHSQHFFFTWFFIVSEVVLHKRGSFLNLLAFQLLTLLMIFLMVKIRQIKDDDDEQIRNFQIVISNKETTGNWSSCWFQINFGRVTRKFICSNNNGLY